MVPTTNWPDRTDQARAEQTRRSHDIYIHIHPKPKDNSNNNNTNNNCNNYIYNNKNVPLFALVPGNATKFHKHNENISNSCEQLQRNQTKPNSTTKLKETEPKNRYNNNSWKKAMKSHASTLDNIVVVVARSKGRVALAVAADVAVAVAVAVAG